MHNIIIPVGVNERRLRLEADKRRQALVAAGSSTYIVVLRKGQDRIICLCCGLGTYNTHDIAEKWCSFCRSWHSEWDAATLRELESTSESSTSN